VKVGAIDSTPVEFQAKTKYMLKTAAAISGSWKSMSMSPCMRLGTNGELHKSESSQFC